MRDTNQLLNEEIIDRLVEYSKLTGVDIELALKWAVNRLTAPYWPDEGFQPKKAIFEGRFPCWIIGEYESRGKKKLKIVREQFVSICEEDQIEIID